MIFKILIDSSPVIGQTYGLANTAMKVYNSTSPVGAVKSAVKGILLDCSPPVIKYPLKCSILALNVLLCITSGGNPMACSLAIGMLEFMLE